MVDGQATTILMWALGGIAAIGFVLFGLAWQRAGSKNQDIDAAKVAVDVARKAALDALETARNAAASTLTASQAAILASTEAVRRELLQTINTIVVGDKERHERLLADQKEQQDKFSNFRVEIEKRFITRDDFKEMRAELREMLNGALNAQDRRADERHEEIKRMLVQSRAANG